MILLRECGFSDAQRPQLVEDQTAVEALVASDPLCGADIQPTGMLRIHWPTLRDRGELSSPIRAFSVYDSPDVSRELREIDRAAYMNILNQGTDLPVD